MCCDKHCSHGSIRRMPSTGIICLINSFLHHFYYLSFPLNNDNPLQHQRFNAQSRHIPPTSNKSPSPSPLPTLLLRRHNPKSPIRIIPTRFLLRSLLRNLAPPPRLIRINIQRTSALRWRRSIDQAFISKLLAADELLGEVAGVYSVGVAVDGFGDDFDLGREDDEAGDELLDCGA